MENHTISYTSTQHCTLNISSTNQTICVFKGVPAPSGTLKALKHPLAVDTMFTLLALLRIYPDGTALSYTSIADDLNWEIVDVARNLALLRTFHLTELTLDGQLIVSQ